MGYGDQTIHEAVLHHRECRRRNRDRRERAAALVAKYGETRIFVTGNYVRKPEGERQRIREVRAEAMTNRHIWIAEILPVQGPHCYICGTEFGEALEPTIDHVFPVGEGGGNRGNILLACRRCNLRKSDRLPKPVHLAILERVNLVLYGEAAA